MKEQLRMGLSSLPAPKNDYEIVVPEDEMGMDSEHLDSEHVEDQSDLDARREADLERARQEELKRRSQAVQRDLPRPVDVNPAIMRPNGPNDPPLTELQRVTL
jgi:pre-mRNA-splicing factor CDC5/CEF1